MERNSVKTRKLITIYVAGGEEFKVVKFDNGDYGAISHKYIDENGKLTKELNGFDMFISKSVEGVIDNINHEILVRNYEKMGYDRFASVMLANGYSEKDALESSKKMKEFYAQA